MFIIINMVQKNPVYELQKMILLTIILVILTYLVHDILYGYMRREDFRSFERHRNRDDMMRIMLTNKTDPDNNRDTFIKNQF